MLKERRRHCELEVKRHGSWGWEGFREKTGLASAEGRVDSGIRARRAESVRKQHQAKA